MVLVITPISHSPNSQLLIDSKEPLYYGVKQNQRYHRPNKKNVVFCRYQVISLMNIKAMQIKTHLIFLMSLIKKDDLDKSSSCGNTTIYSTQRQFYFLDLYPLRLPCMKSPTYIYACKCYSFQIN